LATLLLSELEETMYERNRKKVILDVDTGSDDAIAIMVALKSEKLKVEGICTVWGNLGVEQTTFNTLAVCEVLNMDVPVYAGCPHSMVKDLTPGRVPESDIKPIIIDGRELSLHSERLSGLPDTNKTREALHAVEFYHKYLKETTEPVTIVAVGPLTNLGFLFRMAPELADKVDELIIMGGGVEVSNVSEGGEANVWHDPEALQIILEAGLNPLLVTLDATFSVPLTDSDCDVLESLNTFEGRFAASVVRQRIEYESVKHATRGAWSPIHDALAACACIDRSVLTEVLTENCRVECTGICDGELLLDRRAKPASANATIAVKADKDKFFGMLCSLFSGNGRESLKSHEEEITA